MTKRTHLDDILVIGGGFAGLSAAWQAAVSGKRVRLIAKGWGATHWHSGCIDVLGYEAFASESPCESPAAYLDNLIQSNPRHPYALTGVDGLDEAIQAFQNLCAESDYPLHGSLERNWLLPSAAGAIRPTCLAPETMIAGDLRQKNPMLIVGFDQLRDFYAGLAADNLAVQGIPARSMTLDLGSLRQRRVVNPVLLAKLFDKQEFVDEVARAVKLKLGDAERVGFPAVLGWKTPLAVKKDLETRLGRRIFEIPTLPPSVPGIRLHRVLVEAISRRGGLILDGHEALDAEVQNGLVTTVYTEAAARRRPQRAQVYILATGGILGGGIVTDHKGRVIETILDLPMQAPFDRSIWFKSDFFDPEGHPVFLAGINVDDQFRPLNDAGEKLYENLFAAGTTLANCDALRERSFEGVALATGYWAGKQAAAYETS